MAERWFAGLLLALERLTRFPRRFAFAPEERVLRRGIRQSIVGRYRVLFTVDDEACVVNVLHVRHGARAPFEPDELG